MVYQVPVSLEALVGGEELDVLLGEDAVDEVAEEAGAVEVFGAAEEDVLGFGGVGEDDPGGGEGLDEDLGYGGVVAGCEGGEPALSNILWLAVILS